MLDAIQLREQIDAGERVGVLEAELRPNRHRPDAGRRPASYPLATVKAT